MRMIPNIPYGTHSQAEKRVFDKLRSMSFSDRPGGYTAYHSLNLTRHARKRFGEIDFLICGPKGLFVIEVKGGGVSYSDGVWHYLNRHGEDNTSREGPFKQAESALHGLLADLREHIPSHVLDHFSIGYGVIFPDCKWNTNGAEWDPSTIADQGDFNGLEKWFESLFRYWRDKDGGKRLADKSSLATVSRYLRPEFEAVISLFAQSQAAEEDIARLTEDQLNMVDIVDANSQVLCSGGAGTGKTFMAMELARRWTSEGKNVLLTCKSPYLKNFLANRFAMPRLTVSLASSARISCRRAGVTSFDALIVDEGQDLFDMESLDYLEPVINGGLAEGVWCFFYDKNNQAGLYSEYEPEAFEYLESLNPAHIPLSTNCRNTRVILERVQNTLGADMGVIGVGEGPRIREHLATSVSTTAEILTQEIIELIDQGGLTPANVTILSPFKFEESSLDGLSEKLLRKIMILDEHSVGSFPPPQISFSTISDFKGLENEAIIIVDLPKPKTKKVNVTPYYVAMSRARSVLSLIYCDENL
jgi:hypothetical protein